MLPIDIPEMIYEKPGTWNGTSKKLIRIPAIHLELEHSLRSIAKWESKWHVSFLDRPGMTPEEFQDYCRCMIINKVKVPNAHLYIPKKEIRRITDYMTDPMSARVVRERPGKKGAMRITTCEYFYFLMARYHIPYECENWHFNRLMALIDCCIVNNGDVPEMSYGEKMQYYRDLNEKRRREWGTTG